MKNLIKIAWRNCWRNTLRSGIVIGAIIIGVWGALFIMGLMNGFMDQRVDKMVDLELGDIQVHTASFDSNSEITNALTDVEPMIESLKSNNKVKAYSPRFVTDAYVMSAHGQRGVKLIGVNPELEGQTLGLKERVIEGSFLESDLSYPVLIGKKMAEKLKLRLDSKLQISFTNVDEEQVSKTFKVCGIFNAGDDAYDGYTIFVPQDRINKLTGVALIHELVVKVKDPEQIDQVVQDMQNVNSKDLIESWKTRFPTVAYSLDMADTIAYVLMMIIVLALSFGIINTLIMSILERQQELGVLMAIGMKKSKVRLMILTESFIYGLIGAPIGAFLGFLTVQYFITVGLDLSSVGEGMAAFGYDPILHFTMDPKYYFIFILFVLVATVLGGLYPSRMATKLNPVEAIRSI
ncbi:MAG: ABC transporter permease [Flavobacteriaceae bacterium]